MKKILKIILVIALYLIAFALQITFAVLLKLHNYNSEVIQMFLFLSIVPTVVASFLVAVFLKNTKYNVIKRLAFAHAILGIIICIITILVSLYKIIW